MATAAKTLKTYRVLSPITTAEGEHAAGDTVELDPKQADPAVQVGALEEAPAEAAEEPKGRK